MHTWLDYFGHRLAWVFLTLLIKCLIWNHILWSILGNTQSYSLVSFITLKPINKIQCYQNSCKIMSTVSKAWDWCRAYRSGPLFVLKTLSFLVMRRQKGLLWASVDPQKIIVVHLFLEFIFISGTRRNQSFPEGREILHLFTVTDSQPSNLSHKVESSTLNWSLTSAPWLSPWHAELTKPCMNIELFLAWMHRSPKNAFSK